MRLTLTALKVPLTWGQVLKRTFGESLEDNVLGMAAQLAYYFFFALFPTLLVMLSIASFFRVSTLRDDLIGVLGGVAPPEVITIISEQMTKISNGEDGGLLTIGLLMALWSSSAAMTAIVDTLNTAYDIEEGRPWWKVRLTAIALTIGFALFIIVSVALVMLGPTLAERIAANTTLGTAFVWTWTILQWPLVFALVAVGIGMIYYFAPDAEQDWVWLTPGAVFATALWLAATIGFKFYVATMGGYTESYGFIGGVMVLMLWFYLSGVVILVGAEMNAEIEHAAPYGKDAGEKVPGEKKKIGAARMRAWMTRHGDRAPSADKVKEAVEPYPTPTGERSIAPKGDRGVVPARDRSFAPRPAAAGGGFGDYLIGAGVVVAQAWMTLTSFRRVRG